MIDFSVPVRQPEIFYEIKRLKKEQERLAFEKEVLEFAVSCIQEHCKHQHAHAVPWQTPCLHCGLIC